MFTDAIPRTTCTATMQDSFELTRVNGNDASMRPLHLLKNYSAVAKELSVPIR